MSQDTKARIGIYSLGMLSMAALAIMSSIALIMADFPDASATEVQQLMAIPNLMAIIVALIFSWLANKFPRKLIAVAAPLFIAVGGLLPVVVNGGLPFLLVCSAILGVGVGLISNITQVLINDLVSPEKRQAAMGQYMIFVNIGSVILTTGGGMLAANGWRDNYLIYALAIPVLIAVAIFIPMYKADIPEPAQQDASAEKPKLGVAPFVIAGIVMALSLTYNVFPNNVSLIILGNNLGDAAMVGIVNSLGTVGGILAGATLDKFPRGFQQRSLGICLIMNGLALLAIAFAGNLVVIAVASFFIGFALATGFSQSPFVLSLSVNPMVFPMAMSIYSIGNSLGGTISPTLVNAISGSVFSGSAADCFIVGAVIAIAVGVIFLLTRFQAKIVERAQLGAPQQQ